MLRRHIPSLGSSLAVFRVFDERTAKESVRWRVRLGSHTRFAPTLQYLSTRRISTFQATKAAQRKVRAASVPFKTLDDPA